MCLGAIGMATIGALAYLGHDPYGGAVGLHRATPHLECVPMRVEGPRPDVIGRFAAALHVVFYLRHEPVADAIDVHRARAPDLVEYAHHPIGTGILEAAESGSALPVVLEAARIPASSWAPTG